jgi:hypothetical protein
MKPLKLTILIAWIGMSIFMCYGCLIIKTDHVFIATLFKTVDANDLDMVVEPDSTAIGSGVSRTKNDSIKASAIVGGVPVRIEVSGDGLEAE